MATDNRLNNMVTLVEERGYLSVKELSQTFDVSEVTVRRDLQRLHDEQRLLRTYGGAARLPPQPGQPPMSLGENRETASTSSESSLIEQVDVLIAISLSPRSDMILLERAEKHGVPIVAESLAMQGARTLVAVDNYQAGCSLGRWAGQYAQQHFAGQARMLDLTYHLSNTQDRSKGFLAGLQEIVPEARVSLSLNTQADWQSAYQLTTDAIQVYPEINIIFGINDTTVEGAIQACRDLGIPPETMLVLTFGLEGNTLREELQREEYLKAGLAMFPEIVGPTCIEAAIASYNHVDMPAQLVTPHMVLTADNLGDVYEQGEEGWRFKPENGDLALTIPILRGGDAGDTLPEKVGFLVPFSEHEWYKNLSAAMQGHANKLGIELDKTDAAENLKDELVLRKLSIAEEASKLVKAGDVVLIDGGQVTTYLADALRGKSDITVITNAMSVVDVLRNQPGIALISTGGLLRNESQTLTGPTAEAVLRELRANRLFLAVTGVSLDFGLSHTNLAEVTVKQAMIRAAREVILLADHTKFEQESVVQVAPISIVDKVITDNALPASTRLDLSKLGIEIVLAKA
ncbi:MAG: DeoR family transcriptional regulator [Chloroflexota bacterium]|nr:DeoR family transcriptional regulator [Chloroflexota bacterium]